MALNTSKCNHLPPLPFKGLTHAKSWLEASPVDLLHGSTYQISYLASETMQLQPNNRIKSQISNRLVRCQVTWSRGHLVTGDQLTRCPSGHRWPNDHNSVRSVLLSKLLIIANSLLFVTMHSNNRLITRHSSGDEIRTNVTSLYFATPLAFNALDGGVLLGRSP